MICSERDEYTTILLQNPDSHAEVATFCEDTERVSPHAYMPFFFGVIFAALPGLVFWHDLSTDQLCLTENPLPLFIGMGYLYNSCFLGASIYLRTTLHCETFSISGEEQDHLQYIRGVKSITNCGFCVFPFSLATIIAVNVLFNHYCGGNV